MNPYREPGRKLRLVTVPWSKVKLRAPWWRRLWHAIICGDPDCPIGP